MLLIELIDTLWNVNVYNSHGFLIHDYELIDTLWNVNYKLQACLFRLHTRINRYIMECKYLFGDDKKIKIGELIDTLWNVNDTYFSTMGCRTLELIDTLWNVNEKERNLLL